MRLYAVRHARVAIEPDIPPERWHLSEAGLAAAGARADRAAWDDVAQIYHSPQPKTAETAEALGRRLGLPRAADPDLREVRMDVGFLQRRSSKAAWAPGWRGRTIRPLNTTRTLNGASCAACGTSSPTPRNTRRW